MDKQDSVVINHELFSAFNYTSNTICNSASDIMVVQNTKHLWQIKHLKSRIDLIVMFICIFAVMVIWYHVFHVSQIIYTRKKIQNSNRRLFYLMPLQWSEWTHYMPRTVCTFAMSVGCAYPTLHSGVIDLFIAFFIFK